MTYPMGGTENYAYDSMGRLYSGGGVTSATYGAAGQLLQLNGDISETRTYNSRLQLTSINAGYNMNLEYRYDTTGHNNGQITSMMDNVTGEEVNYTYDSLKRLITAITTGPEWGLNFSYDGFGNRTAQTAIKGTAPSWQQAIDPANNHVVGWSYDANGNVTYSPETGAVSYDVENRLSSAGYAPDNRRVWLERQNDSHFVQFYDPEGKLLGQYGTSLTVWVDDYTSGWGVWEDHRNIYFGGRLTYTGAQRVYQDRLGSVRKRVQTGYPYTAANMSFYPYGEERTTTSDDTVKFATYTRDSQVGLDYADQRYYNWHAGRFLTPDPYHGGVNWKDPQSWNRYTYAFNDPVNASDPSGRFGGSAYGEDGTPEPPDPDPQHTYCLYFPDAPICGGPMGPAPPTATTDNNDPEKKDRDWMSDALAQATADLAKSGCGNTVFAGGIAKGHDPAAVLQAIVAGAKYGSVTFSELGYQFGAVTEFQERA